MGEGKERRVVAYSRQRSLYNIAGVHVRTYVVRIAQLVNYVHYVAETQNSPCHTRSPVYIHPNVTVYTDCMYVHMYVHMYMQTHIPHMVLTNFQIGRACAW